MACVSSSVLAPLPAAVTASWPDGRQDKATHVIRLPCAPPKRPAAATGGYFWASAESSQPCAVRAVQLTVQVRSAPG